MTTLRKTYGICPIETARVNTAPVHIDRERDISWSRDIFTYSVPGHYFSVPDSDSISLCPDWQQKRFNFKCMKRLWNLLSLCSVLYDVHGPKNEKRKNAEFTRSITIDGDTDSDWLRHILYTELGTSDKSSDPRYREVSDPNLSIGLKKLCLTL
jgi:hypothetical protein